MGMTCIGLTLADANDRARLEVVGFDTSVPAVILGFEKGSLSDTTHR